MNYQKKKGRLASTITNAILLQTTGAVSLSGSGLLMRRLITHPESESTVFGNENRKCIIV